MLRKRCRKCGEIALYKPRVRRCRFRRHGHASYWCYGQLEAATDESYLAVMEREVRAEVAKSPRRLQDVAKEKLLRTEREQSKNEDEMAKTIKRLGRLQKRGKQLAERASRYSAKASMTDEEVDVQRRHRLEQQQQRDERKANRRIELEE